MKFLSRKDKIKQHLPALLLDYPVGGGNDPAYQRKRRQVANMERNNPKQFKSLLDQLDFALNEIDIFIDDKGEFVTKRKER